MDQNVLGDLGTSWAPVCLLTTVINNQSPNCLYWIVEISLKALNKANHSAIQFVKQDSIFIHLTAVSLMKKLDGHYWREESIGCWDI